MTPAPTITFSKPGILAPPAPATAAPTGDPLARYITKTESQRLFVMIYGGPVTGKTTGARTFPNPTIVDFENNLPAGTERTIPMWNDAFVDGIEPRKHPAGPANRRDCMMRHIVPDLAKHMPAGSTTVIDSLTRIETWYNLQEDFEPKPLGSNGKVDTNTLFRNRLTFFDSLLTKFSASACNIVMIVHSQFERDENREVTRNIRPALMGQIGEKLPGYFPILLQAVTQHPLGKDGKPDVSQPLQYLWRVRSSQFEKARVPKSVDVDFIPQNYNELLKYV